MANPNQELGASIGGLLGIFNEDAQAYGQGQLQGYSIQRAMQDAARARNQRLISDERVEARGALPEALGGVYQDPSQLALAQAVLRSNETINLGNLGEFQRPDAVQAFDLAGGLLGDDPSGDEIAAANRAQDYLAKRRHEPVLLQGGVMRPSGVPLGDPDFQAVPTPQAQAQIDQGAARVGGYLARQGVLNAATAGGTGAARPGKPGKAPTTTQVESGVLQQARAAIAAGADPGKVAQRLRERGYPGLAAKVYVAPTDLGE